MKKVIISCMAFLLSVASASAEGNLDLKQVPPELTSPNTSAELDP